MEWLLQGGEDPYRWCLLGILVVGLTISGAYRRRAHRAGGRIERSSEPTSLIAARVLVTLPLFLSLLAYLVNPASLSWSQLPLPGWIRWLGAIPGLLALPLIWWVMRSLGHNVSETVLTREGQELVTEGPYRWVRHPLYSTGLMLLAAATLLSASLLIAGLVLAVVIAIRWVVVPREEAALIARFGDDYRRYRQRTGALLPRLTG